MSTEIQTMTGAEAGLNSRRQIEIALQTMVECDGEATNEAIYAAIERYMGGALLSQQGRHTLRSLINRDAVRQGLVDPHGQNQGVWRITDSGRARMAFVGRSKSPQYRIHFSYPIEKDVPLYVAYIGPKLTKR